MTSVRAATPGYFEAVGTRLRRGRLLEAGDRPDTPLVVVVDETLARRFWPDGNAIGQQLRLGNTGPWRTIVGIVGSVKHGDLAADTKPYVYLPHAQRPSLEMDLVVRTTVDPASLTSALRREIHALDPSLALYDVHTLDEAVERSVGTRRLTNRLLAWFSIAAVVLASLGIYGVTALSVGQRVQEFGVRLALGASRAAVLRLVLRQGLTLAIVGVAIGLAGAAWLTQYVSTLLFNVAPLDPAIFAAATLTLVAVALLACYVPARRATRTDPLVALRTPRSGNFRPAALSNAARRPSRRIGALGGRPDGWPRVRLDSAKEAAMSRGAVPRAVPRRHRTRSRAGRATGGTLAVSIVAHALILAAMIVVPLLATDTLPDLADSVGAFRPDALPPPDPPAPPITRTTSTAQRTQRDVAPVEPHDEILDEQPRAPSVECASCVVDPTAVSAFFGPEGGTGPAVPLPPPPPSPPSKPVRLSAYRCRARSTTSRRHIRLLLAPRTSRAW